MQVHLTLTLLSTLNSLLQDICLSVFAHMFALVHDTEPLATKPTSTLSLVTAQQSLPVALHVQADLFACWFADHSVA